jgi:hypothetical protein
LDVLCGIGQNHPSIYPMNLKVVQGDVMDLAAVEKAVSGQAVELCPLVSAHNTGSVGLNALILAFSRPFHW